MIPDFPCHSKKLSAFTLIELLIVVAIIAILAAIAIPNFLEAQVRSKVSRVRNDMRTTANALEAYRADTNHYPPFGQPPYQDYLDVNALNPGWITTPVAYITSKTLLMDPFRSTRRELYWWTRMYYYRNFDDARVIPLGAAYVLDRYGWWRLTSCGPDRLIFNANMAGDMQPDYFEIMYDPTNGTVSIGDIERNQKYSEGKY